MAGRGATPKSPEERVRRAPPVHEWQATLAGGWQHGGTPKPPSGLLKASRGAWETWFAAWWAAHWAPEDLPALRQLVRLYDQVERGEFQRHGELRIAMDTYGITPKGRQDRRWAPPRSLDVDQGVAPAPDDRPTSRYAGLRAVEAS